MSDPRITDEAVQELHRQVHEPISWNGTFTLADARGALEAAVPLLAPQPVSDQCLRGALEKICDDYIAIDIELLRETLAAHPVEPAVTVDLPAPVPSQDCGNCDGGHTGDAYCSQSTAGLLDPTVDHNKAAENYRLTCPHCGHTIGLGDDGVCTNESCS